MLLARKGYRVLLVDKASFPSDTISTHIIWPHGVEMLDRWGLVDRLAATGCPPTALNFIYDLGSVANGGRGGFCPRRTVLDELLVDAAVESGVEFRENFTVESLVFDSDRVAGIKGRQRGSGTLQERAKIVIGADGINSFVAKTVGAQEYDHAAALATYFYSYYHGFDAEDLEHHARDYCGIVVFPTNERLTLITGIWPSSQFKEIRSDIEGSLSRLLELTPSVKKRVQAARREEKWYGTAGVPNFFRKPCGPGWALVGDAGYNKDPITAQGISDAFIDSQNLTDALDDGFAGRRLLDEALEDYHSKRDERVRPLHRFTIALATLQPAPAYMLQLFAALRRDQDATDRFFSATTGSIPFREFMNRENIARITAAAA
jgi:2-polyprenyl-6-methoxyphenol hydroxylase-like FAD-dependent oxidoreductase